MPLPRHQHVPSFQVTSQANPTCRPRLPAVPLPARPGGPAKLGTELGPADAHLSPPAAPCPISLEWKRWSDATPLPCTSGRKPVRVNPRLGPVPREQDKAEHAQDPHQHPWYGSLPPPNNRPRDNSSRQRGGSSPRDPSPVRPPSLRTPGQQPGVLDRSGCPSQVPGADPACGQGRQLCGF